MLAVDEALAAPHTAARAMVTDHARLRALGTPIKLSRTPGGTQAGPPRFGQDGAAVLAEHGYSAAEIAALEAEGMVLTERRNHGVLPQTPLKDSRP